MMYHSLFQNSKILTLRSVGAGGEGPLKLGLDLFHQNYVFRSVEPLS